MIRVKLTIDISAIKRNIVFLRKKCRSKIFAVVKANAYGLGAKKIAENIEECVDGFCVATVQEGIELRENGIKKEILVLGVFTQEEYRICNKFHLTASIVNIESIELLSTMKKEDIPSLYVAIDTGMNRIGLDNKDIRPFDDIDGIRERTEGYFTHYYSGYDQKSVESQNKILVDFIGKNHFCNSKTIPLISAGATDTVLSNLSKYDQCRTGIGLYGFWENGLEISVRFASKIVRIKWIKRGESVGYGATYVADKDRKIATVCCGYADGYPVDFSNRGVVCVKGKLVPVVGRVCMDYFMIDVTDVEDCAVMDEVVLFGKENANFFEKEKVFMYSFLTGIGNRVKREYIF